MLKINVPLRNDDSAKSASLFFVTGEASGDFLAARLMEALRNHCSTISFTAVAGPTVAATGARILFDHRELVVMGLFEVFTHLPLLWKRLREIKQYLAKNKPDLVILVDFSGFNLRVAKIAKSLGCPVLFYVSPKIWAWKAGRIQTIQRLVDHMAVLFAFEVPIYEQARVPVTLVGHPLIDVIPPPPPKTLTGDKIIALLPGSRRQEIHALMPTLVQTAQKLKASDPTLTFWLPIAPGLSESDFAAYDTHDIHFTHEPVRELLKRTTAAIVCSGTATLEVALCEVPMVIVYKLNWASYWVGRMVLKVPYIGLCNLVAEQCVAPELIQSEANPETISKILLSWLTNRAAYAAAQSKLAIVREKLGGENATEKMAALVQQLLGLV